MGNTFRLLLSRSNEIKKPNSQKKLAKEMEDKKLIFLVDDESIEPTKRISKL